MHIAIGEVTQKIFKMGIFNVSLFHIILINYL